MSDSPWVVRVERVIPAPPARIFALLADPSRHPDIDGSGTVRAAHDPSRQLALGDEFGMTMRRGLGYSMTNRVVELEADRRITWAPRPTSRWFRFLGGRRWTYELTPVEGGTLVQETWDIRHERGRFLTRVFLARSTREGMERSLERLEALVAHD